MNKALDGISGGWTDAVKDILNFYGSTLGDDLKQHEAGRKVPELAREMGVSAATIYTWKSKYGGMTVSEAARLRTLEDENRRLKKLLADAGYPSGFEVTMNCPNDRYVNDGEICQAVASMRRSSARGRSSSSASRAVGRGCCTAIGMGSVQGQGEGRGHAARGHAPGPRRSRSAAQWNCSSSVEPVRAFTEEEPPWITVVTSSK